LNTPGARRIGGAVSVLAATASGVASQLPGISFFTHQAPPNFGPLSLMTGGLTLAIFVWVFSKKNDAQRVRNGIAGVTAAVLLAIAYTALLNWVTVPPPAETGVAERFQIGFGLSTFSLTTDGINALRLDPLATAQELMLMLGGFQPGGTGLIWKPWTITVAWLILSLTFVLAYIAWSFGLACIAARLTERS
jgi:hypothetical protein